MHNDVLARWTQFFPRCSSRIFGWYNLSTTYAPWSAVVSGVACWSKYATEALYLYATTQVILSVRQGHRITWNRFCCNHNKPGCNIPVDLRLEHVNRTGKDALRRCGHQNLTAAQTDTIGRALLNLHDIGRHFDRVSGITGRSSVTDTDINKDETKMLGQLLQARVFSNIPGRLGHQGFLDLSADPFSEKELDLANLKRYCLRWGAQYSELQRGVYSRLYPIPRQASVSSLPVRVVPKLQTVYANTQLKKKDGSTWKCREHKVQD